MVISIRMAGSYGGLWEKTRKCVTCYACRYTSVVFVKGCCAVLHVRG